MKLIFVCLRHDPAVWALFDRVGSEDWVRIKSSTEGPSALVMCSAVQETHAGFLRMELAPATESQPRVLQTVSVPAHLVAWSAEAIPEQSIGFLSGWDWPFPRNRS